MVALQVIKSMSKATFGLIVTVWTALSIYIPSHFSWSIETITLLVCIGNAVIVWLGSETGHNNGDNPNAER